MDLTKYFVLSRIVGYHMKLKPFVSVIVYTSIIQYNITSVRRHLTVVTHSVTLIVDQYTDFKGFGVLPFTCKGHDAHPVIHAPRPVPARLRELKEELNPRT